MPYITFALAAAAVCAFMLAVWIRHWWHYIESRDEHSRHRFGPPSG